MPLFAPDAYDDYQRLYHDFRWQIPTRFNIGTAVCDRPARRNGDAVALWCENAAGERCRYTFGELKTLSDRLANALRALGIGRGDRVGIVLPQRAETGLAHIAVYKLGAIALPLSVLFRADALRFRLADSGCRLVIADAGRAALIRELAGDDALPALAHIVDCDDRRGGFWPLLERGAERFDAADTGADDPAYLIYTSGTTGPPKGALCAHRCLLGNLPGFELSQNFFPLSEQDAFWTPADWAWTGGLLDALLPAWYYGRPVLGYDGGGGFDPERACRLLQDYRISNAFIPPTALKMMRQVDDIGRFRFALRGVMSAGETVGAELFHWARTALGVDVNEMCGQSECNYIVGSCSALYPVRPGAIGKPYPGHRVDPVDADGRVLPPGEPGELAARRDDPVMMLGYWRQPQAAEKKFRGDYWGLGDICVRDDDGYLWFLGRDDDVISTAGYRVGPGEVEDSLLRHPAVAQCAVIGVPDPDGLRGEIIKAFVVLAGSYQPSDRLAADIQRSVKNRLAAYEYPRALEFIDALPLTTTGKVRRVELRERDQAGRADG